MPTHPKPLSLLSWSIGLLAMLAAVLGATTLWIAARMEAFRDGDTIDGPGDVRWRAW